MLAGARCSMLRFCLGCPRQLSGQVSLSVSNTIGRICHDLFTPAGGLARLLAVMAWAVVGQAQLARPPGVEAPHPEEVLIWAASKTAEGPVDHLRGSASLETTELQLWADSVVLDGGL